MKRKLYIDNLRAGGVILVMVYHVFYMFNGLGVLGGMPEVESVWLFDDFLTAVYPFMMVVLFVLAGMSAKFSLEKRTRREFLRERAVKLIIPSTLGLFVIHWVTGYINIKLGGGLEYIPPVLLYPISVISGSGHLWFAHLLFLYSALILLFKKPVEVDKKAREAVIFGFAFVIWGAAQVLNLPVLTTYRFGIYFAAFALGYFVFSFDEVMERVEKLRWISLVLATVFGAMYFLKFRGLNYVDGAVLQHFLTNFYLWFATLVLLGFGKRHLERESKFSAYICRNSYGYYILHYPVLIVSCYLLHYFTPFSTATKAILALIAEFILTFAANEAVRRIPLVRLLVLGIKRRKRNEIQTDNRQGK